MKTGVISLMVVLFSLLGSVSNAQSKTTDLFHDAEGNSYHQLFVDFHISEIVDMKYTIDDTPVDGHLATDGYSVIIKNYPGDRSVKLIILDDTGAQKEVIKSRCFIDPVILEL